MHRAEVWAPVVAALGASFLTGLLSLGIVWFQRWLTGRSDGQRERVEAYIALAARALPVITRAQALGLTGEVRSGLAESLSIALRQRQPLDPMQLYDWLNTDLQPLNDAWSHVCAVGSQQAVDTAERLMTACTDFVSAATAFDKTTSPVVRNVVGAKKSDGQVRACEEALRRVAVERVNLLRLARTESSRPNVKFALDRAAEASESDWAQNLMAAGGRSGNSSVTQKAQPHSAAGGGAHTGHKAP